MQVEDDRAPRHAFPWIERAYLKRKKGKVRKGITGVQGSRMKRGGTI